jgi:hypothetical protein
MRIQYVHASRFGNGAAVARAFADRFQQVRPVMHDLLRAKGVVPVSDEEA